MKKNILLSLICLIVILGVGISIFKSNSHSIDKIKSINLSTDYEIEQVLKDIKITNANTVNIPIVIKIPNLSSNEMIIDDYSKEKAIQMIKLLKKDNIKIILEAYPWINNGRDYETEYNPKDKEKFFEDWENILGILIKDIANIYNVDVIITGSNFTKLEEYEENWCNIINFTKENFKNQVTYKTSWWYTASWDEESKNKYNEKLNNKLFSQVDFISIAAYFELSDKAENTVEELINSLSCTTIYNRNQNITKEIENFHTKYKKEIFFGELGFPRKNHAASHPWDSQVSNTYNSGEQGRCFEAYRNVFENKDYIKGFSVFALGQKGNDKNFYPSSESIDVISNWYK
ncbi:glycoside hydrolase family 113 [Terrisporobacter petrolearius]|uniref:glycoside hydrolase family 113 n=1 Tax=Terrisporobacter petrolearius TaxID=1460447 RepID=UPI003B00EA3D